MTKTRTSSPYPAPPTGLVRALVRDGWRRAEAEGVQTVRDALDHASHPDAKAWAARAAAALAKEPVRLAFLHRFADEETTPALRQLFIAADPEHRQAIAALWFATERKGELEELREMRAHLAELRYLAAFDDIFG